MIQWLSYNFVLVLVQISCTLLRLYSTMTPRAVHHLPLQHNLLLVRMSSYFLGQALKIGSHSMGRVNQVYTGFPVNCHIEESALIAIVTEQCTVNQIKIRALFDYCRIDLVITALLLDSEPTYNPLYRGVLFCCFFLFFFPRSCKEHFSILPKKTFSSLGQEKRKQ